MRGFSDEIAPHHIIFEAYGVHVRVCASTPELLARAESLLPPSHRRLDESLTAHRIGIVDEEDGSYSVYNGAYRASERGGLDLALVALENQLSSYVALFAPDLVFIHAGAVAIGDKALIMPGESFAGKSTLVEALVRKGATYLSDEFAVLDDAARVHPYAKPLSLRQLWVEGEAWSGNRDVETLGGIVGTEPVPLESAVVTFFVPSAQWNPRRLSSGEAALALFARAPAARHRPDDCLRVITRAIENVTVLEGERGEADEFADILLEGALA